MKIKKSTFSEITANLEVKVHSATINDVILVVAPHDEKWRLAWRCFRNTTVES